MKDYEKVKNIMMHHLILETTLRKIINFIDIVKHNKIMETIGIQFGYEAGKPPPPPPRIGTFHKRLRKFGYEAGKIAHYPHQGLFKLICSGYVISGIILIVR